MAESDEISEEGRRVRFERWEALGVDAIKQDLASGQYRLVGGPPSVQALAREWVRMKEAPKTDIERRVAVLKSFYDQRHATQWAPLPVEASADTEEKRITANICRQLAEMGLLQWKTPHPDIPEGMGKITARGVEAIETGAPLQTTAMPIASSYSREAAAAVSCGEDRLGQVRATLASTA